MVLSQKISITQATQKDLPEIAHLSMEMLKYQNALTDNYFTVFPYEKYLKEFEEKLNNGQYILVAKKEDTVVGFLLATFQETPWYKNAHVCIIDEISVSEKCRSCGIGTALFNSLLSVCKDKKIQEIKLNVYNMNERAKYLYERLGFKDLRQQMSLILK